MSRTEIYKKYIAPNLVWGEKTEVKSLMKKRSRNISKDRKIQDYLSKHKVYLTMTTSPTRLRKITTVLAMLLQNPYISKVYLTLPKKYRNEEPYKQSDINFVKSLDKRIVVRRVPKDLGPLTKMLPTLQHVKDKDALVISVDDDIAYPSSLINELIYYSVYHPKSLHMGAAVRLGDYYHPTVVFDRHLWPEYRKPRGLNGDIAEGWGGIAYKKRYIDFETIKRLNSAGTVCKLSDDLTISFSLAKDHIKRHEIESKYYDRLMLTPLYYGELDDALHHGSGTNIKGEEDANMLKYQQCLELLADKKIIKKGKGQKGATLVKKK